MLLSVSIFSSCNNAKPEAQPPSNENGETVTVATPAALTLADYFVYQANAKYTYEGTGNEYASYTVFVDYLAGNRVQIRSNNGGTEMVKVLENKNGQLTVLLAHEESYYRENFLQKNSDKTEILLQEPLIKGTAWTLADQRKRYISNLNVPVTTPLANYQALEVTTENEYDKVLDYYVPHVGLVKTIFMSNGVEITSSLSKIEMNTPLRQQVQFFYPNVEEDKIYFQTKELIFNTNDLTKLAFEKTFKDLSSEKFGRVLGANVKINSLYLNQDGKIYVDFSKELISEMNAGSGYEGMIIQSITNTLGIYYGKDKVYITIEEKPYASGHIELRKGEFFTVDLANCVELK